MSRGKLLFLVDGDFRRRAAISHCLAGENIHVEPFEDLDELRTCWPRTGVLLVHDEGDAVSELVAGMKDGGDWLPVVGFAENPRVERVVKAIHGGAVDYIAWPCAPGKLAETVKAIEAKTRALAHMKAREAVARSQVERLTRREREVLAGVSQGWSNRIIAEKLAISPRTVEIHRAKMLQRLGAQHTSEAIRIATEAALYL